MDRSFIPHEALSADSDWEENPVLLSVAREPATAPQLIVNRAASAPPDLGAAVRVIEVIDAVQTSGVEGVTFLTAQQDAGDHGRRPVSPKGLQLRVH